MSLSSRALDGLATVVTLAPLFGSVALLGRCGSLVVDLLGVEWLAHGATGRLLFVGASAYVFRTWRAFYAGVEDAVATG